MSYSVDLPVMEHFFSKIRRIGMMDAWKTAKLNVAFSTIP